MTTPDPADTVIEQASSVLRAYLSTTTAIHAARALHAAGLLADPAALEAAHRKGFYEGADSVIREELADPADRDERRNEAYRAQLARADRAEAEVARLRKLVEELGGTA